MGIIRISKKLIPALEDITGALVVVNASDPQLATLAIFCSAVEHLPNFIVLNKCDMVDKSDVAILVDELSKYDIIAASMKTERGLEEIKYRLGSFEGKVAVLGVFNSGKTSLINALTGGDNPVSDMPGTTSILTPHNYNHIVLLDTVGQVVDVSKPLMVSIDLDGYETTKEKLRRCIKEDISATASLLRSALDGLEHAVDIIIEHVSVGGKLVVCGAGASSLVAMEMAGQALETGLPAIVFTNNFATCQPVSFSKGSGEDELALAEYFALAVNADDVVIGVSASGGSGFVYKLLELSRSKGAYTIGITENSDTPLGKNADIIIKSDAKPEGPSSSKIQIAHLAIAHALILTVASVRGVDAEKSIGYMLPTTIANKKMGIK